MNRKEAIDTIFHNLNKNDAVISSTGLISREIFKSYDSERNFYMVGSMGLASSIALGITLNRQDKEVIVIEGDASVLMNLGSLATIGHFQPKNLTHIVLDNRAYASCSEEPSVSTTTDLSEIAKVTGYKRIAKVDNSTDLVKMLSGIDKDIGPTFILAEIELGGERNLPRPMELPKNADNFRTFLSQVSESNFEHSNIEVEGTELIEKFKNTLKDISIANIEDFSGIGIILYDSNILLENTHTNTRLSTPSLNHFKLGEQDCLNFLADLSQHRNPFHDGFVFFNEKGVLTHIAQYFVPSIIPGVVPNESAGIRFHSAKYGSFVNGVIATGVVSRKLSAYFFIKGEQNLIN